MEKRYSYLVSVYLLPYTHTGEVLLLKRAHTGRRDGYRGLVSGHMDGHETPREAMQREAKEEVGITVAIEDMKYMGTEYCKSNTERINIYFTTTQRTGDVENKEPHKHDELGRFAVDQLPFPMDYPKEFIQGWLSGTLYKETFILM